MLIIPTNIPLKIILLGMVLGPIFASIACNPQPSKYIGAGLSLISTKPFPFKYAKLDGGEGNHVRGKDCTIFPLGLPLFPPSLENAVNDALETGKGDIMIDPVAYDREIFFFTGLLCMHRS